MASWLLQLRPRSPASGSGIRRGSPSVTSANIGGCPIYPLDNARNTRIDTLALRAGSTQKNTLIQAFDGNYPNLDPDFGENPGYGITVVLAGQPGVPITYTDAGDERAIPARCPSASGAARVPARQPDFRSGVMRHQRSDDDPGTDGNDTSLLRGP